jgi:nucleoid-associated protein YgaU
MFGRLLMLALVVVIAVGVVSRTSHGAGPERSYVVRTGDTLWSIAAHHYAGDPRDGVWRLEKRNGLAGATVRPGQRLVLP